VQLHLVLSGGDDEGRTPEEGEAFAEDQEEMQGGE
jgi:hypothetical protein